VSSCGVDLEAPGAGFQYEWIGMGFGRMMGRY
jgi:hypothetical protein